MPTAEFGGFAGFGGFADFAGFVEPFTIEQVAARAGGWAWAEGRLFEVVGAWARGAAQPRYKVYFDAASQHHAWRAQLWRERLPGRLVQAHADGLPQAPPGLLGPPSDAAEASIGALEGIAGDVGRLAAFCRVVLPRVVSGYRAWCQACSPSGDAPVARALSMALADVVSDWQQGSGLLVEALDDGDESLAVAAEASARADVAFAHWGSW